MEEEAGKGFTLFGKDISQIPCFRSSWLYGISSGITVGLFTFIFTSKPKKSCHVGFSAICGITMSYWIYCRYDFSRKTLELQRMQEYVEKRVLMEGTEMEKLYDAEVVNVSNEKDV